MGGLLEVLVIFGVHWGITPVTVGNYTTLGYDTFTGLQASAVFSQAGAALGVCLKTKSNEMKKISASAAVTGLFGITEPAIYGVNLRMKKPMICGCIAGAVGGAVAGGFNAVSWSYNMPGIATLPTYFKAGHMAQFIGLLISIAISFVFGAVLTYIVGFDDDDSVKNASKQVKDEKICSPAVGKVIPIWEVKDEVFASETLGKGVGIIPDNGKVYAPFDCEIEMVSDTGHAIGIRSSSGLTALIHVGIDTVKLEGKGFKVHVKEGDFVKKGTLIIEFDKVLIVKKGFDPTIVFIVTEAGDESSFNITCGHAATSDQIMNITYGEVE